MTSIYIQPPKDVKLSDREQETWDGIVSGMPTDFFVSGDAQMLVCLVKTFLACRDLENEIENVRQLGTAGLKVYTELLRSYDNTVRLALTLSTKLRLTQQSRVTKGAAGTAVAHSGSHQRKPWDVSQLTPRTKQ